MLTHERRLLATIIDVSITLVLSLLLNIFIHKIIPDYILGFLIIYFFIGFIYMFLSLIISKDKTVGLYLVSLRMLDRDWSKPKIKTIIIRALLHGVPALYLVNILYMILYKTDVTLFDELSDSFIVKTGDAYTIEDKETGKKNNYN
jgi:uncharacterized RDD family membrane protein YckC